MKRADTVVIGAGLAGLMAALASAEQGQRVTLLSYGSGTLALGTGTIDILGYDGEHRPVSSPREALPKLPQDHPYRRLGTAWVEEAAGYFLDITKKYGFPYEGSLDRQIMVPTAVGTMKPTCLVPKSLDGSPLKSGKNIVIVGIKGMKDFYANIMAENLKKTLPGQSFEVAEVDSGLAHGRDILTLDVARRLNTEAGRRLLTEQLRPFAKGGTVFLLPQILGTRDGECAADLGRRLGAEVIETTCLPPSVNGLRLQNMLTKALHKLGVDMVEDTRVLGAVTEGTTCKAVVAKAALRERQYTGDKFILATGGFYSGGIVLRRFEEPVEPIFGLPVWFPPGEENWSNEQLFSYRPQGFASTGILTDEALHPVDGNGKVIFNNVHVVGRNLGKYDFCFEHSGNGVALVSAYRATRA